MGNKEFADKVLYMRLKQQEYFRLAAEAKKDPSKHEQRKMVLAQSKAAEAEVDELIVKILNPKYNESGNPG